MRVCVCTLPQSPIRKDNVTRVLVVQSPGGFKSLEGEVGFITAKVLSDIFHKDRSGEIIGMRFLLSSCIFLPSSSLFFLVTTQHTHTHTPCTHLSQCTLGAKVGPQAFAFRSQYLIFKLDTHGWHLKTTHTDCAYTDNHHYYSLSLTMAHTQAVSMCVFECGRTEDAYSLSSCDVWSDVSVLVCNFESERSVCKPLLYASHYLYAS